MIRRLVGVAAALACALLLLACDPVAIEPGPPTGGGGSDPATVEPGPPTGVPPADGGWSASVAHVVDGDTIQIADGRSVRYLGINTPEWGQPYYEEARTANRQAVEGKTVWLVTDVQATDRFGRLLAYVWAGDSLVNVDLVRQGYANAYTEPPNVRYAAEIRRAEQAARDEQVGLWTPSPVQVRIRTVHYDAPGADDQNPNGEWVELANEGSSAADLAGWTLKDGANHIYTFGSVRLEPGRSLRVYSGRGTDAADALYWGLSDDAVWSNGGDQAYLRDADGRLVDYYPYSPP